MFLFGHETMMQVITKCGDSELYYDEFKSGILVLNLLCMTYKNRMIYVSVNRIVPYKYRPQPFGGQLRGRTKPIPLEKYFII